MAIAYATWARANRTDANEATLLTAGAAEQLIGWVWVCNNAAADGTFSIMVCDGATATEDYIANTEPIVANIAYKRTVIFRNSDILRVKGCAGGDISFQFQGMKIT